MLLAGMLSTSAAPAAAAQPSAQMFVTRAQRAVADKQLGQAILNFERARLLSPGSDLIARDLAQVRISANLPPSEPRMAGTAAQLLRSDQWGELALVGLLVGAGALFAFVRRVAGRGAFLVIAGLGGLVAAVAFGAAIRNRTPSNLAVVVSAGPVARTAPSAGAPASFTVREGTMVLIEHADGRFVLISGGGRRGWVPRSDVETVLPEN